MAKHTHKVILPKLATKATSIGPGSEVGKGDAIPKNDLLSIANVKTLRATGKVIEAIRKLAKQNGTTSAALFNLVQVANSGFTIKAYDGATHELSKEGTQAARSTRASMDVLYDYKEGFSDKATIDETVERSLREVAITGAVAGELVMNKARLPDRINIVAYETLTWKSKGDGRKYPIQNGQKGEIKLDIPNFWVAESHKEANAAYSTPMLEAALETSFYYGEFIEDMRRTLRTSGHSRLIVKINMERVKLAAPDSIKNDEVKLKEFMDNVRDDIQEIISSMEPEDALVAYDVIEVDSIKSDRDKTDYKELLNALSGLMATSLKSHPSILGMRISGSQSLSNTESLIFLKVARAIQQPVEKLMSRALTLAVRLYGFDVYVKFRFKNIDLRPESELEAFRTMKQTRVLQLLSLGFYSDDEASEELGTGVRPDGAPELSGTMFMDASSNNGKAGDPSPNTDAMGAALQPDTPNNGGGKSQ